MYKSSSFILEQKISQIFLRIEFPFTFFYKNKAIFIQVTCCVPGILRSHRCAEEGPRSSYGQGGPQHRHPLSQNQTSGSLKEINIQCYLELFPFDQEKAIGRPSLLQKRTSTGTQDVTRISFDKTDIYYWFVSVITLSSHSICGPNTRVQICLSGCVDDYMLHVSPCQCRTSERKSSLNIP